MPGSKRPSRINILSFFVDFKNYDLIVHQFYLYGLGAAHLVADSGDHRPDDPADRSPYWDTAELAS